MSLPKGIDFDILLFVLNHAELKGVNMLKDNFGLIADEVIPESLKESFMTLKSCSLRAIGSLENHQEW